MASVVLAHELQWRCPGGIHQIPTQRELQMIDSIRTIGTEEAARILGCTTNTLRAWVSKRRVPHVKVGRLCRFRVRDLEAFLEAGYVPASSSKDQASSR
jgi:excisionase family DNA binding protein